MFIALGYEMCASNYRTTNIEWVSYSLTVKAVLGYYKRIGSELLRTK